MSAAANAAARYRLQMLSVVRSACILAVQALGWQPHYNSFEEFMASGARDWYSANEKAAVTGASH